MTLQTATPDEGFKSNSTPKINSYITSVKVTLQDALRELLCDIASGEYKNVLVVTMSHDVVLEVLQMLPLFNEVVSSGAYHAGIMRLKFGNNAQLDFYWPDPFRLRGVNSDLQFRDLPRTWPDSVDVQDILTMCNRLGTNPKHIETSDLHRKGDVNRDN